MAAARRARPLVGALLWPPARAAHRPARAPRSCSGAAGCRAPGSCSASGRASSTRTTGRAGARDRRARRYRRGVGVARAQLTAGAPDQCRGSHGNSRLGVRPPRPDAELGTLASQPDPRRRHRGRGAVRASRRICRAQPCLRRDPCRCGGHSRSRGARRILAADGLDAPLGRAPDRGARRRIDAQRSRSPLRAWRTRLLRQSASAPAVRLRRRWRLHASRSWAGLPGTGVLRTRRRPADRPRLRGWRIWAVVDLAGGWADCSIRRLRTPRS